MDISDLDWPFSKVKKCQHVSTFIEIKYIAHLNLFNQLGKSCHPWATSFAPTGDRGSNIYPTFSQILFKESKHIKHVPIITEIL